MAVVNLNKAELKKVIGELSDEEIDYKLNMFGIGVENITKEEVSVEIAPNRPDMLSVQGIYRALRNYSGQKVKQYTVNKPLKNHDVKVDSSLKSIRPYTMCAIVKNLQFNDEKIKEIIDVQEKLHSTFGRDRKKIAIGIYPLEKIELPITFKAENPEDIKFIPLEMDKEMTGRQVISKHPTGREYAHLLEGFDKYPVFRDNKGSVLSMPPIINSQMTGKITEETKEVFIECSGSDILALKKTLNILVTSLADMGGEIYGMRLDYEGKKIITPDLKPEKIKISIPDCEKLLGIRLKEAEIKKLLEKMGHSYNKGIVEYPAYRADIMHPVDIYEDVAIAYGYDNFNPELPDVFTIGKENEIEIKKRKIAEILCGLGLLEISTYHLARKEDLKKNSIKGGIEVLESKTDYSMLRPDLLVNALKTLSENTDAKYPQKIFELGKIFESEKTITEKEKLSVCLTGDTDFTEIKQILDYLMRMLDKEYKIEETENLCFIPGRVGKIITEGKEIGLLGEISPSVIENWNLKMPVSSLEIEIEEL
ncbi:phenylalanine--tRNA ligase subunit beta [Candidatus Pacearchaeota archaeon RBG_13_36_9]|nr:MAG: phenylalanine--tRNA ligase subunit beta [Candidatus Pacearchaeota archaeon RBG_13_36_9]